MKKIINYIEFFLIVLFLAFMFKVIGCSISKDIIQGNLDKTGNVISLAGLYPRDVMRGAEGDYFNYGWSMIDYFTEWILINGVANVDSSQPFKSAMANYRYYNGDWNDIGHAIKSISETIGNEQLEMVPQYWWGSLALIRILMVFFSYDEILILFNIIFYILLGITLYKVSNVIGRNEALALLISFILVNFTVLTYMLEFGMVFIITFVAILLILKENNNFDEEQKVGYVMVLSGMLTNYFDWLSTPLISCVLPLEVYTIYQIKKGKMDKIVEWIKIINYGIIWCVSYAGMLVLKWFLSIVILGGDIWDTILARIKEDTSIMGDRLSYFGQTIYRNINMIGFGKISPIVIGGIIIGTWGILIFYMLLKKMKIQWTLPLLICSVIPFIWMYIFSWHTHEHFWFTYRNLIVTIFPVFIIILSIVRYINGKVKEI